MLNDDNDQISHMCRPATMGQIAISGCFAGVSADICLHSIDTIKVKLQTQDHLNTKYKGFIQCFHSTLKANGIKGLYSGAQPVLFGSIVCSTLYFVSYERSKLYFGDDFSPTMNHLASSVVGEVLISGIYVPTEVIKSRMQTRAVPPNNKSNSTKRVRAAVDSLNTIEFVKGIVKKEGLSALFKGYSITMLRDIPATSIMFCCYEKLKSLSVTYKKENMNKLEEIVIGAVSGGIAGALTTPFDHLKTLIQVNKESNKKTLNMYHLLKKNYTKQGLSFFYRGLFARSMWSAYQAAILFFVYEETLSLLK